MVHLTSFVTATCDGLTLLFAAAAGLDEAVRMNDDGQLKILTADCEKQRPGPKCTTCGGFGYVMCSWCQGSMKSRKHGFTEDSKKSTYLRCTVCNENGLQPCGSCK